jgi:Ni/Fe-hydrogenase subunit HybB-like protein
VTRWRRQCATIFGPLIARLAEIATAIGVVTLIAGFVLRRGSTVLAALASSWLLFAGISAGGVALAASIRIAQGRWARQVLPTAEASAGFFAPALGLLALLTFGARFWMPREAHASVAQWLPLATRDLVLTSLFFWMGRRFVRAYREGRQSLHLAVAYIVLYALILSLWAVDLVMSLREWAPSSAIPAYYFMGAFISALAWVTFVSCVRKHARLDANGRHDIGKLLFGFITFLAYLLWSIFLPTWYANVPDETGQLLARWEGVYRPLSLVVILVTFVFPFLVLLTEEAKRNRGVLALGSASVLVGLFVERFLLVFPSLNLNGGILAALLAAGMMIGVCGLFTLTFGSALAGFESLPTGHNDAFASSGPRAARPLQPPASRGQN